MANSSFATSLFCYFSNSKIRLRQNPVLDSWKVTASWFMSVPPKGRINKRKRLGENNPIRNFKPVAHYYFSKVLYYHFIYSKSSIYICYLNWMRIFFLLWYLYSKIHFALPYRSNNGSIWCQQFHSNNYFWVAFDFSNNLLCSSSCPFNVYY